MNLSIYLLSVPANGTTLLWVLVMYLGMYYSQANMLIHFNKNCLLVTVIFILLSVKIKRLQSKTIEFVNALKNNPLFTSYRKVLKLLTIL